MSLATKTWEPPFITPHSLGALNKFGQRGPGEDFLDNLEGIPIESLIAQYGSPLFVTSETRLRHNVRRFRAAFSKRYPDVVHGWSYKTNYTSAICNALHQEGSWAEVVSGFEYAKARKLGVPGARIIFNGPNKDRAALELALAERAVVHVDNLDELERVESIALDQDGVLPIGMRINLSTGYTESWSRFGFNLESGEAHDVAGRILRNPRLRLNALHCHIGTFILEPRAYAEEVRLLCEFTRWCEQDGNVRIHSLDIGGGFASKNHLQGVYLAPSQSVPEPEDYAQCICEALHTHLAFRSHNGKPMPRLFFEAGRAIVDDSQSLISTVIASKRLADGRRAQVLDAGVNLLFTAFWYNHQVRLTRPSGAIPEETVLYGPLCMNIDALRHSVLLPPLQTGDRLVFSCVGAYNNTQWMQFIEYRPAVVLLAGDGQAHLIREAENLESMCWHDRLPAHLKSPSGEAVDVALQLARSLRP